MRAPLPRRVAIGVGWVEARVAAHQDEIGHREDDVEHDEHAQAERHHRRRRRRRDRVRRLLQPPGDPWLPSGLGQDPAGEAGEERQRDPTDSSQLEPFRLPDVTSPEKPAAPQRKQEHQSSEVGHHAHRPVGEPDLRHVVAGTEPRLLLRLVLVQPDDLAVQGARREVGEKPGNLDRETRGRVILREAADLEDRERGRLLGIPQGLGSRDLHRLCVRRLDPERVPPVELKRRQRDQQHDRELRRRAEDVAVAPVAQVPRGNAEHHEAARQQARQDHVDIRVDRELLEHDRRDVVRLRGVRRAVDLVADRMLHPRVRDDDEVRRKPRAEPDEVDRRQVQLRREPIAPEHPQPDERRLEHERTETLDRKRRPEHITDVLREGRPVHPELELLHKPRRRPDREIDQEQRPEEPHETVPLLIPRPVVPRLHDRQDRRQAKRQRHEREMEQRRRRKLPARQLERARSEKTHYAAIR